MTSPLWRHPVTWRHRDHVQSINHGRFPIGCALEPSRYLASFPGYLAPKLWQRLLRDDVINNIIRPISTIREEHIGTPYTGTFCWNIVQFRQELPEKIFKKIIMAPLWRHPVTWRHRDHVQSTDYDSLICYPLEPSRYLASFKRQLAPKLRQRLLRDDVINDVIRPLSTIREEHIMWRTMYRNIVLKYRPILTRIAGEEAF